MKMAFGFDKFRQARPSAYNNIIYKNNKIVQMAAKKDVLQLCTQMSLNWT